MDSSLEEAAHTSGAGYLSTLRIVTLPLAWPAILAATLYTLTIAISSFDIPLVIGLSNRIYVFSTYLNAKMHPTSGDVPRYELAAAFGTVLLVLALVLTWWYARVLKESRKYEVISGKNYRPRLVALGKWRYAAWLFLAFYFLCSKIMPLVMVVWASLLPYFQPFSRDALDTVSLDAYRDMPRDLVWEGLRHTLILMLVVPTLAVLMSVVFSWLVLRSNLRFRAGFDFVAFLPHAVPSVVFGFAGSIIALFYLGFLDLYGSMTLLTVIMALTFLSFSTRISNSAIVQINRELEEAAAVAGAGTVRTMRLVVVPLIRPALAYAWIWIALLAFRELTLPVVLFSRDNVTLSYVIWNEWLSGSPDIAAAISVLMLVLMMPFIFLYWRFRGGVEAEPR
jgi:iron(III) transport system permease protein